MKQRILNNFSRRYQHSKNVENLVDPQNIVINLLLVSTCSDGSTGWSAASIVAARIGHLAAMIGR